MPGYFKEYILNNYSFCILTEYQYRHVNSQFLDFFLNSLHYKLLQNIYIRIFKGIYDTVSLVCDLHQGM